MGRIDHVKNGLLTDWKSGVRDDLHRDQITFYALAYWLTTGSRLAELAIFYTSDGTSAEYPAPEEEELLRLQEQLCEELANADRMLASTHIEARPSIENCRFCPVRQLCDEYWTTDSTKSLRLGTDPITESALFDVELTVEKCEVGLHTVVLAGAVASCQIRTLIPVSALAGTNPKSISLLRLLQGRVTHADDEVVVVPVYGSEVFYRGAA
jgi:hypothetical protein